MRPAPSHMEGRGRKTEGHGAAAHARTYARTHPLTHTMLGASRDFPWKTGTDCDPKRLGNPPGPPTRPEPPVSRRNSCMFSWRLTSELSSSGLWSTLFERLVNCAERGGGGGATQKWGKEYTVTTSKDERRCEECSQSKSCPPVDRSSEYQGVRESEAGKKRRILYLVVDKAWTQALGRSIGDAVLPPNSCKASRGLASGALPRYHERNTGNMRTNFRRDRNIARSQAKNDQGLHSSGYCHRAHTRHGAAAQLAVVREGEAIQALVERRDARQRARGQLRGA